MPFVPVKLTDEEILRRVQCGERTLYVELFDRYYARVERYARSQNNEAVSTLASDTFQSAYRNVDSYQPGGMSYLAYLLKNCRRLVLMERERPPGAPAYSAGEDRPNTNGGHGAADRPLSGGRNEKYKGTVRDALHGLSAEDRELIYLAYEADLSRQDVMTILEEPSLNALSARLYQAMQRLNTMVMCLLPDGCDADVETIRPPILAE